MKRGFELTLLVALVMAAYPAVVRADGPPGRDFEFEYVIQAPSASDPILIPDASVQSFALPLTFQADGVDPSLGVEYMEFEIGGLSHTAPMDLQVILLDPFGGGMNLMDEAGDQEPVQGVNLIFSDKGVALPHAMGEALISDTVYLPDGRQRFSQYLGRNIEDSPWRVVVIDDDTMAEGSFQSMTLRGHYVPEPATLSLLAFGALALMRRRH